MWRGLGWKLRIIVGSEVRLPRVISQVEQEELLYYQETHINNLSILAVSEVTEKGQNFTSSCEADRTNLRFSAGRSGRLWEEI